MAYCFYNGVKLPELPSGVIANYPYCWIRKNDNTQHYDLLFTRILGYYNASLGGIEYGTTSGTTDIVHYRIPYSSASAADGWDSYQTTNTWMALDANRTVMWSNHYIPNGSLTATVMYFDAHEAIPETTAYQIERETLVGIADQVRRVCDLETDLTPEEMERNLRELNVDLMETFVMSGPVEQVIYPDNGCCGFSKVTVGAIGGDYPGGDYGDWEPAEDETFGDDYYNVPTGNYDYSAGTDDTPSYIPEIPGEGYKALFCKKVKKGNYIKFATGTDGNGNILDSQRVEIKSDDGDFYVYAAWGRINAAGMTSVHIYMYSDNFLNYKIRTQSSWSANYQAGRVEGFPGYWGYSNMLGISALYDELPDYNKPRGVPLFSLGNYADSDAFVAACRALATSSDNEDMGSEQFLAFVSPTQILYDGSVINNADKSPMTIYECNAGDKNTWTEMGTTDGTDYPVGAYTLVWNSHDLKDMTGQFVTQSKSDEPIAEMSEGDIGIPVERNETYTIEGETVNTFVSAAQKVTGGKTPLTPTDAALALDEYYNHPAEEGKW